MSANHSISIFTNTGVDATMNDPLRAGIRSSWEQQQFVDFKIQVEDQEFHVHRIIIAAMSDYFQAMLSGGMAESEGDSVTIKGVKASTVEALIRFIYTYHLDITLENVTEILSGAMYFQIKSAIKMCTQFMVDNLDEENCLEILTLFKFYGLTEAVEDAKKHACEFLRKMIKEGKTDQLPYDHFEILVENWEKSEMGLFCFILQWVKSDEENRKKHFDDLLSSVRFPIMTTTQLSELREINLRITSKTLHALIDKALGYQNLPIHQRVLDDSQQTKIRSPESFVSFAFGSGAIYVPHEECFVEHKGMVLRDDFDIMYKTLVVNNFLIASVCLEDYTHIWTIFDPRTQQWEEIADGPSTFHVMANNKHLFSFGKHPDDENIVDQVLRYNFQTNLWSHFQSMTKQPDEFAAFIFENGLYVSGGVACDPPRQMLTKMDRLDLNSREWESKAPMLKKRCKHFMAVLTLFGEEVLCIVDVGWGVDYYNRLTDQWSTCTFSFSQQPPKLEPSLFDGPSCRGNSLFVVSNHMDGFAELTFPKEGNKVTVEFSSDDLDSFTNSCPLLAITAPGNLEIA